MPGLRLLSPAFGLLLLYYESTEKTTDRRIALITSNTSLCLAVTAAIGIILAWSFEKKEVWHLTLPVVAIVSFLAILFCRWWSSALISYKDLNAAKFEVINKMAPGVVFPSSSLKVMSFRPFEREWDELKARKGLQKYKGDYALTVSELVIPKSFMLIFLGSFVFSVVWFWITNYPAALSSFWSWLW
jgi:hypothetical protein